MTVQPVDAIEWMLPRHPRSAARARIRLLRQAFDWHIHDESAEIAMLLLSELVANACHHPRVPRDRLIGVRLLLPTDTVLRVEVADAGADLPVLRRAAPEDESGRGLELVDALSTSWGAHSRGAGCIGKIVWFELALSAPAKPTSVRAIP
ncbi:ATP-binding protein [Kitasatospora sp. NPDC094028]